jgi:Ala-tRNA(Pro) deacylase
MAISTPIKNHLEENHVAFSILTHASARTAQGAAAVIHVSGRELAKTVVVQAGKECYLAVLPALCHVQREALSQVIGHPAQLASEREFDSVFPDCELGAMPPLGELYALPVYVDESLIADKEIVFNAGTHRDAVRMNFDDFVSLASPTVCSFAAKG